MNDLLQKHLEQQTGNKWRMASLKKRISTAMNQNKNIRNFCIFYEHWQLYVSCYQVRQLLWSCAKIKTGNSIFILKRTFGLYLRCKLI